MKRTPSVHKGTISSSNLSVISGGRTGERFYRGELYEDYFGLRAYSFTTTVPETAPMMEAVVEAPSAPAVDNYDYSYDNSGYGSADGSEGSGADGDGDGDGGVGVGGDF